MSEIPVGLSAQPEGYSDWLSDLKGRIHGAQQRATLAVNRELVLLYWQIGYDILTRQTQQGWGTKVIERLALDLRAAFPDMKGFSLRNLKYMRAFAQAWPDTAIVQQAVAQLPWGHNLVLLDKLPAPRPVAGMRPRPSNTTGREIRWSCRSRTVYWSAAARP
jgi:Uncharacterized conserved protein